MTAPASLDQGLLAHWSGERSPDGTVWDRSPAGIHGNYGRDARWIWFTNPRAVRHVDRRDRTYITYLGGPTGRDLVVAAFDHDDGSFAETVIAAGFSTDDHTNPSLSIRPDGHLLVFWTGHNGDAIHYRLSTAPERIDAFDPVQRLEQESVTYPNPVRAPGDPESLYLFYRDRVYTADTTDDQWTYMGDGELCYRVSTDGGRTWSEHTRLVTPPNGHYAMYFVPARGDDAIHFFFTDAERGGDAPKWHVLYAAFRDGTLSTAAGDRIATDADRPATRADLELVYDSTVAGHDFAWIWDAAVDSDDNPVAVYATFPSTLGHEYRYARWDGEAWQDYHLTDAGRYIAQRPYELHYSGGLSIDRDDPTVVYGSVAAADGATLRRFETRTGGETWSETVVSDRGPGWDLRPVVPRNACGELPVLWVTGSYYHLDTSQTVLRGLPSETGRGRSLAGDRSHGVDLGFDRYDARTFQNGLTVGAAIRPRTVDTPGVIAQFGGGVTLGVGIAGEHGVGIALTGPDGEETVATAPIPTGEDTHVLGRWDGTDELSLAIDGEVTARTRFTGPLAFAGECASWTLLKGEFLVDRGFDGVVRDVRLYDRPLSARETRTLAGT